MDTDFYLWLRDQGSCGHCAHHCGGQCEEANKLLPDFRMVAPVQTFTVDRDAPAESCNLWEPRSDWADDMRRSYEMDREEAASARKHQLAVAAHKGFEECLDLLRDLAAQGDKEAAELLERIEAEGLGEAA